MHTDQHRGERLEIAVLSDKIFSCTGYDAHICDYIWEDTGKHVDQKPNSLSTL